MQDPSLNADFSLPAYVDTTQMAWQPSPSPSVWRKRLELSGPVEAGRVTSIVRYDQESHFASHPHPDGEEILVLDGVFSDQTGDYPAGSFMLNPEGFSHAPFSRQGCVLLVKLRQYPGQDHVLLDTNKMDWQPRPYEGVSAKPLYSAAVGQEEIRLVRLAPETQIPRHAHPGGEEVFVLEGSIADETGHYHAGSWIRLPPGSAHRPVSEEGCILYVKTGHLTDLL